ncbi:hypothetical protein [Pseudomonas subflava]|uniref:hypothetical protein n=1 Tax=Pseudomonas subflava TaxID=2952933 RepID=UPI0020797B46|nr:hypothetical protein [Pseudomonas subflava]
MTDFREADSRQPAEPVDQPLMEPVTAKERLLLKFYRKLDEKEQDFMRRAIEAMAML